MLIPKLGVLVVAACAATFAQAADIKRGELLLQTCTACHAITGDGPGPDLHGIYGRKSGKIAGYDYSPALKKANLTWDAKTLVAFIKDPQAVVKDTKMAFPGYPNKSDVEDVIAALKRMK